MKKLLLCVFLLTFFSFLNAAMATELVYTPVNPSFGGHPLNGAWLLNQAQAQNKHTGEGTSRYTTDPLEDFENSMTRRVLSMLATKIVNTAFGEYDEDLGSGTFEFGDYTIDIEAIDGESINVTIIDTIGGGITTIQVPYYQ